jgi:hypothetical protein
MTPTIGYPDRWAAFNKRNSNFVTNCYPGLIEISTRILNRSVEINSTADEAIFLLSRTLLEDYFEMWVLAGNGYGIGAYKILRGLYEKVVTLGYLVKHRDQIQRFNDYGMVQNRRMMNRFHENKFTKHLFPDFVCEQIEASYAAVKDQFLDAQGRSPSWTVLDTFSMALQAGYELDKMSICGYVIPNLKIHATAGDLAERKKATGDGTFTFNSDPQERYADSALVASTHLLIIALLIHDDYFVTGLRPDIENLQLTFARCYGASY